MTFRATLGALGPDESRVSLADLKIGFRAGFVIEIVDRRTDSIVNNGIFVFPLNPNQYNLSEPFASVISPGDDDLVTTEENGIVIREITIEGTFGHNKKASPTYIGNQAKVGGNFLSGNEHFLQLRNAFRLYGRLKKDPSLSRHIRMIFHSLKDNDHFIVVPKSFETPRDVGKTRVTYNYRVSMTAIGSSDRRYDSKPEPIGVLDTLSSALGEAHSFFAEIAADFGFLRRKIGNLDAIMLQAGGVITSISNAVKGGADLIATPWNVVANVTESIADTVDEIGDIPAEVGGTLDRARRNLRRMEEAFDRILAFPDRFEGGSQASLDRIQQRYLGERGLTARDIENKEAGATIGTRTRLSRGFGRESGLVLDTPSSFIEVTVEKHHTAEGLGADHDCDPLVIIIINKLRFPYFSEGGGEGIAKPGDTILVPSPVEGAGLRDREVSAAEALYGRDMKLDPKVLVDEGLFDIEVDLTHGGKREATVAGVQNVVQGIRIIVEQESGSNAYLPRIGRRIGIGSRGTIQAVLAESVALRDAVLSDRRVESIAEQEIVLVGDVLTEEITPVLRGKRTDATLVLPIGRGG